MMRGFVIGGLAALGVLMLSIAQPVLAMDSAPAPKPRVDCSKTKNKARPECQSHGATFPDDEIFNAAYWMARHDQVKEALALLATAKDQNDPRVLNATGYATRKLGNVDAALPFYARALEIKPDYVQAREYLGEAYLAKGDVARASLQLAEIEQRCGQTCVPYTELARHIASYGGERTSGG